MLLSLALISLRLFFSLVSRLTGLFRVVHLVPRTMEDNRELLGNPRTSEHPIVRL